MRGLISKFRQAIWQALAHDIVNTAKAAAYSAMLMIFPAVLVITTLVAQLQARSAVADELRGLFDQFLPVDTLDLLQSYVLSSRIHSAQVIVSATCLSIFAGVGVMLSLMEGFHRAYRLPPEPWTFWERRARALLLVPIVLIPLSVTTLVIVFGRQIEASMMDMAGHELRHMVLFFWRMVRWSIAGVTSMAVLAVLYHFGTKRTERWVGVVPGAIAGTLIWFPATLAFGWWVTRDVNYIRFYGSFAAGIATLVWLYITAFSVLVGAELNGLLYADRQKRRSASSEISSAAQSDWVASAPSGRGR
jgi:membrane protein